jgi:putative intracellular protease/amidase
MPTTHVLVIVTSHGVLITGQNPASAGVTAEAFCRVIAASVAA